MDRQAQVIVAAEVTQEANDQRQLVPMLEQVKVLVGSKPQRATADAGYFSEGSVTDRSLEGSDLFIAPDKQKHREEVAVATGPPPPESSSVAERMRYKLRTPEGRAVYKMRKAVVEPVFGQIARVPEVSAARVEAPRGGVAPDLRHPQPAEAFPLRLESAERLRAAAQPGKPPSQAAWPNSDAQNPARRQLRT